MSLFLETILHDVLTGFGFDPAFAIVIIVATPIITVFLIIEIVVAWRVLRFVRRQSSPSPETATDATAQSLDDDWADIALEIERENRNV